MVRILFPLIAGLGTAAGTAQAQPVAPTTPAASAPAVAAPASSGILTEAQRSGYASVFAAIRSARWIDAIAGLENLGDGPLHNIARAELYLAKDSPVATLEQLSGLLAAAPELPQAPQIARLAQTRGAVTQPSLPATYRLIWQGGQPRRARPRATQKDPVGTELEALVQPLIRENQPAAAEALLIERELLLPPDVLAEYQQRIGWSYYLIGDDASARRLADRARAIGNDWGVQAEWLAGLASWRLHDCNAAATYFATVPARTRDHELAAAGHYWAARADMMCGRPHWVQARLRNAARYSETFYGLLAHGALGIRTPANRLRDYRTPEWHNIADRPNVRTAIALIELGETGLADELIKHQARISPGDHEALVHLACHFSLPSTQYWLAHNAPQGRRVNIAARYPTPNWSPSRGWRVDQPLILAYTLKESDFRTNIVSPAGAIGLMQVLPGTAGDLARARGEAFDPRQLTDPSSNIEFGQSFLERLRDMPATGGLLPKVMAAYNAGPLPVSEWNLRQFDRGDPLLYIESIPYWETRGYVPIVMRNYWIYEQASGRTRSTSLEALVQGLWPRFPGLPGPSAVRIRPGNFASAGAGAAP